jgi:4-hydroxy-4-methyl-2-oxoglutarate aldolase
VADDDGVMVVPRADVPRALAASQARVDKEAASREAFQAGELGLDRYGMRDKLAGYGIEYVPYETWEQER